MQELLLKEQEENSLLRDITGVQVFSSVGDSRQMSMGTSCPAQHSSCVQRLEDVTFLDAVVDCDETSLSNLGEVCTRDLASESPVT